MAANASLPLTGLSEAQRTQALERFALLRPALEGQMTYSRMIVGYRLSFQKATALTTALTLRQAICRKEDPRWHAYGIPTVFYSDHGSDFTSKHMEQVTADLPMELIFSQVSVPRGRGKIERFFRSVDQLLLQDTPGYAPKGSTGVKATIRTVGERNVFSRKVRIMRGNEAIRAIVPMI